MRPIALSLTFAIAALSSCTHLPSDRTADGYATAFLEGAPTDCGDVRNGESPDRVQMCIAEALRAGSPFYVWFWLNPVDSFPASGLLLNANQELFVAWYDGGYGMFRRTVFDTTKCAQWELDPAAELKITCQIPDRQSVYLFAMESFVDIDGAP